MNHNLPNYAFIDSQNLNLGIRSQGWKLDHRKLRLYLKNKYNIDKAFIFIGHVTDNQSLYDELEQAGFILVFKPTVGYMENGKEVVKGNVDAELVLHAAAIEYSNYDKAVIITGDGDFNCLIQYLSQKGKLLNLLVPSDRFSKLLSSHTKKIVKMSELRSKLELRARKRKPSPAIIPTQNQTPNPTRTATPQDQPKQPFKPNNQSKPQDNIQNTPS
ncbi:NYN domain-containing protein [Patescibacteria group bacterium]|nr:NYN domain-containing protein [Patescibacteria group bacterium]